MSENKDSIAIYVHIPFCASKCPYCDFYSYRADMDAYKAYISMLNKIIFAKADTLQKNGKCGPVSTLYFGGGTPSIIGAVLLSEDIDSVKIGFGFIDDPEITVEVNPCCDSFDFEYLRSHGANRISVGIQSANDKELKLLGRRHDAKQAFNCVQRVRGAGFENISLDLMVGIPQQTPESLCNSVDFCLSLAPEHLSAYLLKLEEGTVYYRRQHTLDLPDDDASAMYYELLCELMRNNDFQHYEISNFCKSGFESRHNLRYWHDEEYLGFGPSAHSFFDGQRFFYPRSMEDFFEQKTISDGSGGDEEEFIMLGLRLSEGVTEKRFSDRFGIPIPYRYRSAASRFTASGLCTVTDDRIALTEKGFLVSNAVIASILK